MNIKQTIIRYDVKSSLLTLWYRLLRRENNFLVFNRTCKFTKNVPVKLVSQDFLNSCFNTFSFLLEAMFIMQTLVKRPFMKLSNT